MVRQLLGSNVLRTHIALIAFTLAQDLPTARAQPASAASKWEAEIKAYESSDRTNPPPKDAILFVGSSSIRLWQSLARDFPDHKVINRGFGGSHLADSVAFVDRIVIPYRPKMILLYAGDNDIADGKTPEEVLMDFKTFVKKVHAKLPKARIAYISIKPSIARWQLVDRVREANRLIEVYCQTRKHPKLMTFIDVFTPMLESDGQLRNELFVEDGLHLNANGYELWTSVIKPQLNNR